ncbi:Alpha/Beta hydrolase protein [Chytriomyces cf. hyalinus JEL632]|nr:Alpha/Beta hydrolase protein [Chytriomyces cf. hyalinus JEL632]
MSALNPTCCTLAPVQPEYVSKGEIVKIGALDVYVVGPKGAKNAILVNYDIFGDHPNTRQVLDILSSHGFRVAMPDLCRGDPWDAKNWPPAGGFAEVLAHINKNASYESIAADMRATQAHLKAEGSQHFGVIGFCWGGMMAAKLAAEPDLKLEAFVAAHPAGIQLDVAAGAKCPLLLLPAKDDPKETFDEVFRVVSAIHPSSKQVRFDDAHHGFLAARADFKNELLAKRANEGIREMHDFFVAHLGKSA